jgi:hypothetical protein
MELYSLSIKSVRGVITPIQILAVWNKLCRFSDDGADEVLTPASGKYSDILENISIAMGSYPISPLYYYMEEPRVPGGLLYNC